MLDKEFMIKNIIKPRQEKRSWLLLIQIRYETIHRAKPRAMTPNAISQSFQLLLDI